MKMKVILIVTGKTDSNWLQKGVDEYAGRISRYVPFEMSVVPGIRPTRNSSPEFQKQKEGELLLPLIEGKRDVYLLDEKGTEFSSRTFAGFLEKKMAAGCRELVFITGGPYGFPSTVDPYAAGKISLSKLTFSHQMVRLLFLEQLYRAMTILRGEPYHHD